MKNPQLYFKKIFSQRTNSLDSEIRPYHDWQVRLISAFIILALVFLGHYWLYREFLNQSTALVGNNQDQVNLFIERQNLKTIYTRYEGRTKALNDLLAKPASRIDPGR
ncbi:MAG: hypothetical protein AAB900_02810 [Patescibacteria group bacterium]